MYLSRILVFVYGELKFEEMKLCELLCKIRPARATSSYQKNGDVNVGKLGSPAEAQAGGKGIDIGVLTVHRPETIELFVLGDVMAEARWEL